MCFGLGLRNLLLLVVSLCLGVCLSENLVKTLLLESITTKYHGVISKSIMKSIILEDSYMKIQVRYWQLRHTKRTNLL